MKNKCCALTFDSLRNRLGFLPLFRLQEYCEIAKGVSTLSVIFENWTKLKMSQWRVFTHRICLLTWIFPRMHSRARLSSDWRPLGHPGVTIVRITPGRNNLVTCDHKHGRLTLVTPAASSVSMSLSIVSVRHFNHACKQQAIREEEESTEPHREPFAYSQTRRSTLRFDDSLAPSLRVCKQGLLNIHQRRFSWYHKLLIYELYEGFLYTRIILRFICLFIV